MQKLNQVFTKLTSFSLNSKNIHAFKHNGECPEFHLKDINSVIKLASTFSRKCKRTSTTNQQQALTAQLLQMF
jgi:hypothetical protein